MKIALILSTNASYRLAVEKGHPYKSYAPLTLARLASLVPAELNAEVRIIDLICEKLPPDLHQYDVVGISSITCGSPFAYRLADNLRSRGVTVVMGGTHATAAPDEAEKHMDSVVVGYGEKSWPQLLLDYRDGKLKKRYTDFSDPYSRPLPLLQRHTHKGKGYFFNPCIEFSRGCPHACGFCVVSTLNSNNAYSRAVDETMAEVKNLGRRVLFLDSNFINRIVSHPRLGERLAEEKIRWYAAGTASHMQDGDIVKNIAQYGCRGLLIGFESINPGSLEKTNKSFADPSRYAGMMRQLHDHGIQVLGSFVFGLEDDTPGVFEATVEFVNRTHIDILHYGIATPFPATKFHALLSEQNRITETDWEYYDTEHVVFKPKNMSARELYEGLKWAYKETYSFSGIMRRMSERFSLVSLFGNLAFRNVGYTYHDSHSNTEAEQLRKVPDSADVSV